MAEEATPEVEAEVEAAAAPVIPPPDQVPSAEEEAPKGPTIDPAIVELLEEGDKPVHEVDIKMLLEAGVHFGHQTKRWNPKMARFIFGKRNDIHILDLQKTLKGLRRALKFLQGIVKRGGKILFVSTKRQAQEIVGRAARKCDQFWVTERWLGGMLTNYETMQKRVKHLKHLKKMQDDGIIDALGKKEASRRRKELSRLEKYLCGIEDMKNLPDAMFVIDPRREAIAIKEARKLGIKLVAIVDTNCDPDEIDYVIPGNDDAIRAIKLVTNHVSTVLAETVNERNQAGVKAAEGDAEAPAEEKPKPKKKAAKKKTAKKKAAKAAPKADDSKADEAKADEAKAEDAKAEAKADEAKADDAKAAKAAEPKAAEAKEAKAEDAKADEAKADDAKADEAKDKA